MVQSGTLQIRRLIHILFAVGCLIRKFCAIEFKSALRATTVQPLCNIAVIKSALSATSVQHLCNEKCLMCNICATSV